MGGVRPIPPCKDCGEPSLVGLEETGEALLTGGDCGRCDGVEGRERDFVEFGESFGICDSSMLVVGLSLLDMVSFVFRSGCIAIRAPSFSTGQLLDIRNFCADSVIRIYCGRNCSAAVANLLKKVLQCSC